MSTMADRLQIYDTTLRDGAQGEGVHFGLAEKLSLTRAMDAFGMDYIEGGFPASNEADALFFQKAQTLGLSHARLAAFGMTRRAGVAAAEDTGLAALARAFTPVVTIVGKADVGQAKDVLGVDPEENLRMVSESVAYLKALPHVQEVFFDAEHFFDGYRRDPGYAVAVLRAAASGGANCVVLCDTNGGSLTDTVTKGVKAARALGVPLGIHAHNDGDLAVANTIAAVGQGVRQVQGTVNGLGERCGNADLCSVLANLLLKRSDVSAAAKLALLRELSLKVYDAANMTPRANQPYVGQSAFAHKAGLHVNGLMKNGVSYEHIDPTVVGAARRVLVSSLSGVSNVDLKLREMGLELSRDQLTVVLAELKKESLEGRDYEGADASLLLLACRTVKTYRPWFTVEDSTYHDRHVPGDRCNRQTPAASSLSDAPPKDAMATVKGRLATAEEDVWSDEEEGQSFHTVAEGSGPVDAFDAALRKALKVYSPRRATRMNLDKIRLVDYRVRVHEGLVGAKKADRKRCATDGGTAAKVRVLVTYTDGKSNWTTLGVHQNVVRASSQAVAEAYAYKALITELHTPSQTPTRARVFKVRDLVNVVVLGG